MPESVKKCRDTAFYAVAISLLLDQVQILYKKIQICDTCQVANHAVPELTSGSELCGARNH